MSALLRAILDQQIDTVRQLAASEPGLLSERTVSGTLPFELAHASGYLQIAVALLRAGAPGSERIRDFGAILTGYLADLSHRQACAGWLNGIEFVVWGVLRDGALAMNDPYHFNELKRDELDDLRFLSEKCRGWPYWDDREQRVSVVPLARWEDLYRDWFERQGRHGLR